MKASYLICYDITCHKRLARVFRFLKGRAIHLQYSVFLAKLKWDELIEIKKSIAEMINPKEDDIRIYPIPSGVEVIAMGQGDRVPEGVEIYE